MKLRPIVLSCLLVAAGFPRAADDAPACDGPEWTCTFVSGRCPMVDAADELCAIGTAEATAPEIAIPVAVTQARARIASALESHHVRSSPTEGKLVADSMANTTLQRVAIVAVHRSETRGWVVLAMFDRRTSLVGGKKVTEIFNPRAQAPRK